MSPLTHLLASWLVAAKGTENPRDCRLVVLAGVLPDVDGAGLLVDIVDAWMDRPVRFLYGEYHHYVLHGLAGGVFLAVMLGMLGRQRMRVVLLGLLVFHLHLLADLVGSRGPTPADLWSIYYWGPFSREPAFTWAGQWRLDGWVNRWITVVLLGLALWWPARLGHSVVGLVSRRADTAVVAVLVRWRMALAQWFSGSMRTPDPP